MNKKENLETQKYVQLLNTMQSIDTNLSVAGSYVQSELLSNGIEFLEELARDKDMQNSSNLFQKPPFGGLIRYLYLLSAMGAKSVLRWLLKLPLFNLLFSI